ncbi:MAG: tRNA (adenosine(37)-N6)-dimethylallyltransferase MiaA [Gemmatimonadaceae bacterium]
MADADVLVVCGPTAAGKSSVAMWIAEQRPTTIISADSRQIYRGFDIGTAKPTVVEQRGVPHRGVDIVDAAARYSAAAWADAAGTWIDDARGQGREALVVGGTGLYLRALFDGLFEEPALDPVRRAELATTLAAMQTAELRRWVESIDPPRAPLGRAQLLRSIEIALLTGHRLSDLHRLCARQPRWQARYLVVDPGPALAGRSVARIDSMFQLGWQNEVIRLTRDIPADAPAWNAAGYGVVRNLAAGEITRASAIEQILIETRQYAKRQRTWFRNQLPSDRVTRVDPLDVNWKSTVERWMFESHESPA